MISVNSEAMKAMKALLIRLEQHLDADWLSIVGPIRGAMDGLTRLALEAVTNKRRKLFVMLHSGGGVVEIAERIVNVIRNFYQEVVFIVPNTAMSAATILAMSGDAIMMDYFSCLGPIDPQVEREGKLVPTLSYLVQWNRFIEKSQKGTLTEAEFLIMRAMDIAELHQFEMARDLSISLLEQWLARYKFKDWLSTETRGTAVTPQMRAARAKEIAVRLMTHDEWGSHGRGIPMKVLQQELKLKIDDFGADPVLASTLREYFDLLTDYLLRNKADTYVHSREFD